MLSEIFLRVTSKDSEFESLSYILKWVKLSPILKYLWKASNKFVILLGTEKCLCGEKELFKNFRQMPNAKNKQSYRVSSSNQTHCLESESVTLPLAKSSTFSKKVFQSKLFLNKPNLVSISCIINKFFHLPLTCCNNIKHWFSC